MNLSLFTLIVALSFSALIQFIAIAFYIIRLRRPPEALLDKASCPKATIIQCLRGADPYLHQCLDRLLTQDYPNYDILFMVDHPDDSAMAVLKESLSRHSFKNYRIETLRNPLSTCSLKCSSLVQAVKSLDASTHFIALVDADTIPHPQWLLELASALAPGKVGAATGNRWYLPAHASTGALVRYFWNAAAIVQMYLYGIAWGGTLAIKMECVRSAGLLELWKETVCEDAPLRRSLALIGRKVVFVPALMMINRETVTLEAFLPWLQRQLLLVKLYDPCWPWVVVHGVSLPLMLILGWCGIPFFLLRGDAALAGGYLLSMVAFHAFLWLLLRWLESSVHPLLERKGDSATWPCPMAWPQYLWAMGATTWVYARALSATLFLRRIEWRGIHYAVDGPRAIRMEGYRPYQSRPDPDRTMKHSI